MTIHTPKAFLRGRNQAKRPHSTYLNLVNSKAKAEAEEAREYWAKEIKANRLMGRDGKPMSNPVTGWFYRHPTRGFKFERF